MVVLVVEVVGLVVVVVVLMVVVMMVVVMMVVEVLNKRIAITFTTTINTKNTTTKHTNR